MDFELIGEAIDEAPPSQAVPVMYTILGWIGFNQAATRDRIRGEEGFEMFVNLAPLKRISHCC